MNKIYRLINLACKLKNPLTAFKFLAGRYTKGTPLELHPRQGNSFSIAREADRWLLDDLIHDDGVKTYDSKDWGQCILKEGVLLRQGTSDTFIYKELMIDRCYDECIETLHPNATVLDIGAHIGLFSKLASPRAKHIYGYEADKENYALACSNTADLDNVTIHHNAIWSHSGEQLFMDKPTPGSTCSYSATTEGKGNDCTSLSLDSAFKKSNLRHCSLLKMDIEGGEYASLLYGETSSLDQTEMICLEYHPDPEKKHTVQDLISFLQAKGFEVARRQLSADTGILIANRVPIAGTTTFSVVIPTMGTRPELLDAAISSVLDQSYPPKEVIIVNNGMSPLDNIWDKDTIIVQQCPYRIGVAQARNIGSSLASSEFVSFLDDDDLWHKDYLKHLAETAKKENPDCMIARLDRMDEGVVTAFKNPHKQVNIQELLIRNPGTTGSTTTVRRTSFLSVGGYNPHLPPSEDKSLILEMLFRGYNIQTVPEAQAIMRFHSGERLSDPNSLSKGIANFYLLYSPRMSIFQKLTNKSKLWTAKAMASNSLWDITIANIWRSAYSAINFAKSIRRLILIK